MSKYGQVIKKAREGEDHANAALTLDEKTRKPENQKDGTLAISSEDVNLSIKVSRARRKHWVAEARRQDTTLTAAIITALVDRFGEPEKA